MTTLAQQIDALPDEHAINALALALERQGHAIDPFSAQRTQAHAREALAQPEITSTTAPDADATPAALARTALHHLADHDEALIARAITITPDTSRFDPATLAIGSLVLMAFHADINLERDPQQGWKFHFRTKPISDATIGKLLGQLLGVLTNPKP
jgi:hypothetical protein